MPLVNAATKALLIGTGSMDEPTSEEPATNAPMSGWKKLQLTLVVGGLSPLRRRGGSGLSGRDAGSDSHVSRGNGLTYRLHPVISEWSGVQKRPSSIFLG